MAVPGVSTVGVKFGYAAETVAGTKPTAFTQLTRINQIGGINIEYEQIDASALEDEITKYISGRGDTGGSLAVTINLTDDTLTEWQTLITAYKTAKAAGKEMWFETWFPDLTNAFYFTGEPPKAIPQPEVDQNGLLTAEMGMTVSDYKGPDKGIEPQPTTGGA